MKHYLWFSILCLSGLMFVACSSDEDLTASAKTGFVITLGDAVLSTDSRAVPAELEQPIAKNFSLYIKSATSNYVAYDGSYTNQTIITPVGEYSLTASWGKNSQIAYDEPYYEGTTTATVENNEITSVTIPCKVANSLVSVEFSNPGTFDNVFSSYGLRVAVGSYALMLDQSNKDKSIYFPADREDVKFYVVSTTLEGKTTAHEITDELAEYLPLKAGDHAKVTLTMSNLGLTVDKIDVEQVSVNQTIPIYWLPKPKATGFGSISLVESEDAPENAIISYTAASAVEDISLTFKFEDKQYASYNKEFKLSTLSEEESNQLSAIGLELSSLTKMVKGELDFKTLIESLQTNAGVTTHNTITFKVQANDRWSEPVECSIDVKKPEFTVSVYPGNIWTKEFTVTEVQEENVTAGNAERLRAKMQYQYSLDGKTWSVLPSDLRLSSLTPETKYYVRAVYRDAIISETVEVTTYPTTTLPNGDMETWTAEERGYYYALRNAYKLRTYYPYSGSAYWNTNNDFTTRYRDASTAAFSTVYLYNSFPAVSYTPESHGGSYAAELRNTAAGRGNTSSSKSSYDCNNVPGELFLGEITVTNQTAFGSDKYTITEGREYQSRPTAIDFWYKYSPYTTDYFKVYVAIYDANDNIIGTGSYQDGVSKSSYTNCQVDIEYDAEFVKSEPAKLYIYFASSIYSGSSLPYHSMSVKTWYNGSSRTNTTLSGSVFTVDDISLIYGK